MFFFFFALWDILIGRAVLCLRATCEMSCLYSLGTVESVNSSTLASATFGVIHITLGSSASLMLQDELFLSKVHCLISCTLLYFGSRSRPLFWLCLSRGSCLTTLQLKGGLKLFLFNTNTQISLYIFPGSTIFHWTVRLVSIILFFTWSHNW